MLMVDGHGIYSGEQRNFGVDFLTPGGIRGAVRVGERCTVELSEKSWIQLPYAFSSAPSYVAWTRSSPPVNLSLSSISNSHVINTT